MRELETPTDDHRPIDERYAEARRMAPDAMELVFRATSYGHFLLVNAICIAPNAPPCPHPVLLTAGASGPSMMERSYRLRSGREAAGETADVAGTAGEVTSVTARYRLGAPPTPRRHLRFRRELRRPFYRKISERGSCDQRPRANAFSNSSSPF